MKIAYLIQAYSDYNSFKELVDILLKMKDSEVFVHLDKKSNLDDFFIDSNRVHFIDNREFVSWAGYAQGKLIFNLINAALKNSKKFDYYCFLSESDYPVLMNDGLINRLSKSKMIILNCSEHQPEKIERYWFFDFGIKSPKINKYLNKSINLLFYILYKIKLVKKDNTIEIDGKKCPIYFSSPFWCLDYEKTKYVSEVFNRNIKFQKYFKTSFASCELMVSTIIGNSKYIKECVVENKYINLNHLSDICFFKYTGPRVDVLTDKDYNIIIDSNKPFIRKVKRPNSDKLIDLIQKQWK